MIKTATASEMSSPLVVNHDGFIGLNRSRKRRRRDILGGHCCKFSYLLLLPSFIPVQLLGEHLGYLRR